MMQRRYILGPAVLVATVIVAVALGPGLPWAAGQAGADKVLERALAAPATVLPTTVVPTTEREVTTVVPVTPPPTTSTLPPPPPPTTTTVPAPRFTIEPYRGLGAWLDVYDWSTTFARHAPTFEDHIVDYLAGQGVQTMFIQASKWDAPEDVVDPARLLTFIERAHQHGISVVAWYLPTLEDPARDLQRMLAIAAMPVDGLAVDIESRKVGDVGERNRRLVELSGALRAALPGEVLGAIPLEPVLIEDVNPSYWPAFPWVELAPSYDVWLPMAYWTNRRGGWRDAYLYTAANIDRVRAHIGRPDAPVHALGGIGDGATGMDMAGFRIAAAERGAIGGSLYDLGTTLAPHWPELLPFRDLRPPK